MRMNDRRGGEDRELFYSMTARSASSLYCVGQRCGSAVVDLELYLMPHQEKTQCCWASQWTPSAHCVKDQVVNLSVQVLTNIHNSLVFMTMMSSSETMRTHL